jgi:hypothetical protein
MTNSEKTISYTGIGTGSPSSDSVPIPAVGIGTIISALSDALGSRKNAAAAMGVSTDSLQRYIREENMPPFDAAARLCAAAGVRMEWLATGMGPQAAAAGVREPAAGYGASQDLSVEHLTIAHELADEVLRGLWLPRRAYAELVALVYNALVQGLPFAQVLEMARPAARQRAGEGAGDGGEQGLDGPGPSGVGRSAAD